MTPVVTTRPLTSRALRLAGDALKLAVVVMSLFIVGLIADGLLRSFDWAEYSPVVRWLATGLAALFVTLWMLFGAAVAWQLSLALTLIGGLIGGGLGALLGFMVASIAGFALSARDLRAL